MRRYLFAGAAAVLLAALILTALAWRAWTSGPSVAAGERATITLRVAPGATLRHVAGELHRRGLLEHPRLFLLGARLTGRDRNLQVGRYELAAGASPRDLLRALLDGRPLPVVVVLPEGMLARDLAAVLADSLRLDAAAILAAADALIAGGADTLMRPAEQERLAAAIAGTGPPSGRRLYWCEGYLAPDTYHFAEATDAAAVARAVVGLQLARLARATAGAWPPAGDLSPHALLTLASLVEAEARRDDERARIAAVYHNRLQRRMRLEADPTVAFWLDKRGERLLYRDLEVDSPFNTYRRAGLPTGPIGSPGAASLQAVARPDTASDHLYFVADGEGGHVFSRTLDEHQRAVARYRELMRERRR